MIEIGLDQADPNFREELREQEGAEEFSVCFTCRTCTASCPIAAVDNTFNPARIIRMALLGLRDKVLKSDFVWLCSSCYACQERCPQGVMIAELMVVLKNMAAREGNMPPGIRAQRDTIKGEGRIYPLDDFDNKKRAKVDLPPLPTSCEVVEKLFPR